eukprot:TRINITY_DN14338_c0_g1_i1.p1 TRINITY_DN14338_c0_g1~~TRINITY_DN14338_c0_g1_i1.p1  ORF type:complete len:710 (+),score=167.67 TRINITY_DN14338_c0_g1_i1:494-2623(+)
MLPSDATPPTHMSPIGLAAGSSSCLSTGSDRGPLASNGVEDALALAGSEPRELYCQLLQADDEERRKLTPATIAALQQHARVATMDGDEGVREFVSQHGPQIVEFAYECPIPTISTAFKGLLEWLRGNCRFNLEEWVMEDSASEDAATHPATPQLTSDLRVPPPDEVAEHDLVWRRHRHATRRRRARRRLHADPAQGGGGTEEEDVSTSSCSRSTSHHHRPSRAEDGDVFSGGAVSPATRHDALSSGVEGLYHDADVEPGVCVRRKVSSFIPMEILPPLICEISPAQELFTFTFLDQGQVPNWVRVLSLEPQSTLTLYRAWTALVGCGPLPAHMRCYLVVMAASLHRCDYWIRRGVDGFIAAGGDASWLDVGVSECPKLRRLAPLLARLAHRPWSIDHTHIAALVSEGYWTLPEVVHALGIAASACSLCGFAHGLGVNEEHSQAPLICGNRVLLSSALAAARAPRGDRMESDGFLHAAPADDDEVAAQPGQDFDPFSVRAAADEQHRQPPASGSASSLPPSDGQRYTKLCPNDDEVLFSSATGVGGARLIVSEYNWRDDAAALIDSLLPAAAGAPPIAELLDEEFATLARISLSPACGETLGPEWVHLPRMVFLYVSALYGIVANDMTHKGINSLVGLEATKKLKGYFRSVACLPENMKLSDYHFDESWKNPLTHSDKVRIALIAAGARKQAALVHAMRAVSKYLARRQ